MTDGSLDGDDGIVEEIARRHGVPVDVVLALLDLEREFPDMGVWGAKTAFLRRVGEIVAAGALEGRADD